LLVDLLADDRLQTYANRMGPWRVAAAELRPGTSAASWQHGRSFSKLALGSSRDPGHPRAVGRAGSGADELGGNGVLTGTDGLRGGNLGDRSSAATGKAIRRVGDQRRQHRAAGLTALVASVPAEQVGEIKLFVFVMGSMGRD
jgi:hypothetical protein